MAETRIALHCGPRPRSCVPQMRTTTSSARHTSGQAPSMAAAWLRPAMYTARISAGTSLTSRSIQPPIASSGAATSDGTRRRTRSGATSSSLRFVVGAEQLDDQRAQRLGSFLVVEQHFVRARLVLDANAVLDHVGQARDEAGRQLEEGGALDQTLDRHAAASRQTLGLN